MDINMPLIVKSTSSKALSTQGIPTGNYLNFPSKSFSSLQFFISKNQIEKLKTPKWVSAELKKEIAFDFLSQEDPDLPFGNNFCLQEQKASTQAEKKELKLCLTESLASSSESGTSHSSSSNDSQGCPSIVQKQLMYLEESFGCSSQNSEEEEILEFKDSFILENQLQELSVNNSKSVSTETLSKEASKFQFEYEILALKILKKVNLALDEIGIILKKEQELEVKEGITQTLAVNNENSRLSLHTLFYNSLKDFEGDSRILDLAFTFLYRFYSNI